MRKAKMIGVSLIVISTVSLVGCDESSPSESTVEKQVKQEYAACNLASIHDFKKLNGYPQQDGSYLVDVQYKIVVTPTSLNEDKYKEYASQIRSINPNGRNYSDMASDYGEKAAKSMHVCLNAHVIEDNKIINDAITLPKFRQFMEGAKSAYSPSNYSSIEDYYEFLLNRYINGRGDLEQKYNDEISKIEDKIAENNAPGSYSGASGKMTEMRLQSSLDSLKSDLANLDSSFEKAKSLSEALNKNVDETNSCLAPVKALDAESARLKESAISQDKIYREYRDDMKENASEQCTMISLFEMEYPSGNKVDFYGKEVSIPSSRRLRLINSDNGWVVKN